MPYPDNLRTAQEVEQVIRDAGALPATVAVLDGVCLVGLTPAELERLAQLGPGRVAKCSRRDLAAVMARRGHGATTVSATMLLAHRARIPVFVTGGVGGVHRGGESSMDVSADLTELGRTPVCVVSAGVKSILDIPRTLEVLETNGVAVAALAADEFPAFFTRRSGFAAPLRVETTEEAAALVHASSQLGLGSGILIGVPIPAEAEAEAGTVQAAIDCALREAEDAGISGRDATPFLLRRVAEITGGASLAANIALIKNNALQGARIAVELARLRSGAGRQGAAVAGGGVGASGGAGGGMQSAKGTRDDGCSEERSTSRAAAAGASSTPAPTPLPVPHTRPLPGPRSVGPPVVVGGTVADLVASPAPGSALLPGTSTPGRVTITPGGVGRNIAEALSRLDTAPIFLSAVGDDALASGLLQSQTAGATGAHGAGLACEKLDMQHVRRVIGGRTAAYAALHTGEGDLSAAVADMELHAHVDCEYLASHRHRLLAAPLCIVDANLQGDALRWLTSLEGGPPVWLEPVSEPKAALACAALASRHAGAHRTRIGAARAGAAVNTAGAHRSPNVPRSPPPLSGCAFVSPNEGELLAMVGALREARCEGGIPPGGSGERAQPGPMSEAEVRNAAATLVRTGVANVIVTRGAKGLIWARAARAFGPGGEVYFEELRALPAHVRSTRGAGDTFVAGVVWGLLQAVRPSTEGSGVGGASLARVDPYDAGAVRAALRAGLKAAQLTVESEAAVAETLSSRELQGALVDAG
jgi:pseudouridine-5'-phosphate glycosidase/sugar/nucleoside kinase (ribokinase family)